MSKAPLIIVKWQTVIQSAAEFLKHDFARQNVESICSQILIFSRWIQSILVPRALLTRGATRDSGQIQIRIPQKHDKTIYPVLEQ